MWTLVANHLEGMTTDGENRDLRSGSHAQRELRLARKRNRRQAKSPLPLNPGISREGHRDECVLRCRGVSTTQVRRADALLPTWQFNSPFALSSRYSMKAVVMRTLSLFCRAALSSLRFSRPAVRSSASSSVSLCSRVPTRAS